MAWLLGILGTIFKPLLEVLVNAFISRADQKAVRSVTDAPSPNAAPKPPGADDLSKRWGDIL